MNNVFLRATLRYLLLFILCASLSSALYFSLFSFNIKDKEDYLALLENANPSKKENPTNYTTSQKHKNVYKELWIAKELQRLKCTLHGEESELIFDHQQNGTEIIEKMHNVHCWIQEELFYEPETLKPMQRLRHLVAKDAIYHYKNEKLLANHALISHFIAPGHELPQSEEGLIPNTQGQAERIEFFLSKNAGSFIAHFIQATLTNNKGSSIEIKADYADYTHSGLALIGNAFVQNQIGHLNAKKITLSPSANILQLFDEVNIYLNNKAELACTRAYIDHEKLQGFFYGEDQPIIYQENISTHKEEKPLQIESKAMTLQFLPKSEKEKNSFPKTIHMENNVKIHFSNDFFAEGDSLIYERILEDDCETKLAGIIHFYKQKENTPCSLTTARGDHLIADKITIDTIKNQLWFMNSTGSLALLPKEENNTQEKMKFSCEELFWDEPLNQLSLQRSIFLEHPTIGILENDQEVHIIQQTLEKTKHLDTIQALGKTLLTHNNLGITQTLSCKGEVFIDHKTLRTYMQSQQNEEATIEEQICFKDSMGEIYGDNLNIEYILEDNLPTPKKLILEKNVRIFTRDDLANKESSEFLQFALAEQAAYTPDAKEVILFGSKKERVLFYDQSNNLQVSAPGLKIRRDSLTKKELFEGVGDVRFNFVDKELQKMEKCFHLTPLFSLEQKMETLNAST